MPNPKDIHVDVPLSNFAVEYKVPNLLGYAVAPIVSVKKESDKYMIFGSYRENLTPGNFVRADGAPSVEVRWDLTSSDYTCEEYGLKAFISRRSLENADDVVQLRQRTVQLLQEKLALAKEMRVAALLQGSSGGFTAATPSTKWDASGADIEADLNTARHAIVKACGVEANTLIISRETADKLVISIKEILTTSLNVSDRLGFVALPNKLFGLNVLVGSGLKNTATPGQTVVPAFIWTDTATVAYVEPSPSLQAMSALYTFQSRPAVVKAWYDDIRDGEYIELGLNEVEKVVATGSAYRLTDVLT